MSKRRTKTARKSQKPLPALDLYQRYAIDETARYLRISRAALYQRIRAGLIAVTKDGARSFITGTEIARLSQSSRPYSFAAATAERE